jgi:hypothetical protein
MTTLKDQEDALDALENGNRAAFDRVLLDFIAAHRCPQYRMPPTPLDYAEGHRDAEEPERWDGMS